MKEKEKTTQIMPTNGDISGRVEPVPEKNEP